MTPRLLRAYIKPLPEILPLTTALEQATGVGVGFDGAWYRSQKEHWLGWVGEYYGPGAYGRTYAAQQNGRYIYNHIQCAPMLFWLAEALECESALLKAAYIDVTATNAKGARQCAALRDHLGWNKIEAAIADFEYSMFQRLRIKVASHRNCNGGQIGGRQNSKKP